MSKKRIKTSSYFSLEKCWDKNNKALFNNFLSYDALFNSGYLRKRAACPEQLPEVYENVPEYRIHAFVAGYRAGRLIAFDDRPKKIFHYIPGFVNPLFTYFSRFCNYEDSATVCEDFMQACRLGYSFTGVAGERLLYIVGGLWDVEDVVNAQQLEAEGLLEVPMDLRERMESHFLSKNHHYTAVRPKLIC